MKLVRDLERTKHTSVKPRRAQSSKSRLGKRCQIRMRYTQGSPEERTNSDSNSRSRRCVQQSAIQTANGTPYITWLDLDAHKMARSSTSGLKDLKATWRLGLQALTTGNGTSTIFSPVASPLHCLHKETGGSEQQSLTAVAYTC